jgi:hypothetical protein
MIPAAGINSRFFILPGFFYLSQPGYLVLPPLRGSTLALGNVNIVRISLAWSFVITSMLPTIFAARRMRRKFGPQAGHCPTCSYDLTGNVSGICPECGTPVPPTAMATTESGHN